MKCLEDLSILYMYILFYSLYIFLILKSFSLKNIQFEDNDVSSNSGKKYKMIIQETGQ